LAEKNLAGLIISLLREHPHERSTSQEGMYGIYVVLNCIELY
jgi:hypothetical protein